MIDSIKVFLQDLYDSSIGIIVGYISDFFSFINNAWELLLILIIIVLAFFAFKFLKILTLPAIILSQIVMLTASITFMLSFVALMVTSLVAIYNRIFTLSDYINNSFSSLSCVPYIFSCMGISNTFSYFFTELFALFIVVLIIRLSSLFFWAMNFIAERIYRLGVLIGLS